MSVLLVGLIMFSVEFLPYPTRSIVRYYFQVPCKFLEVTFPITLVYWFLGAVLTKCHKLAALKNRNLLSHTSGSQKSEVKVSTGSWFPQRQEGRAGPVPGLSVFGSSLSYSNITLIFIWHYPCVHICFCVQIFSFL